MLKNLLTKNIPYGKIELTLGNIIIDEMEIDTVHFTPPFLNTSSRRVSGYRSGKRPVYARRRHSHSPGGAP
jgi:hypothetical protein